MNLETVRPGTTTGAEPSLLDMTYEIPDEARILCVEQRDLHPLPEWNELLVRMGGLNRFDEPRYRIIWGWQHADYYPAPIRSYFHFERWLPPELFGTEEDWEAENKREAIRNPKVPLYPFPRKGSYFWIHTCRLPGLKPNRQYILDCLVLSKLKLNRTHQEIVEEVRSGQVHQKALERSQMNKISDDFGLSDVIEDYVKHRKRNPSEWKNMNPLV